MKKHQLTLIFALILAGCGFDSNLDGGDWGGDVSTGGSLARFSIVNDYLYVVNDMSLVPINIADLDNPITHNAIDVGVNIETLFPYKGNLFIGSSSAVYIYAISTSGIPAYLSTYWHSTGCDPVVVKGDYAYVTLREGQSCGNFFDLNVLEVLDVSNLQNPTQINQIGMRNPSGLGIGCNNKLFVCERSFGFVQFDLTNPAMPIEEEYYADHAANDVIVRDSLLIVTGNDGVYQYDCSGDSLNLLSVLPIAL